VDWGWEQEGNALFAYGFPWDAKYWSQTDLNYAPQEKLEYDPLRMDYPAEPLPPIVGRPRQGAAEPTVGYVFDFSRGLDCWGGFGLGVEGRSMCQVVLAEGRTLRIEGKEWDIARREAPLPRKLLDAAKANGLRYGVTIQIKKKELEATVRAGKPGAIKQIALSAPLTEAQRHRMVSRHMAIIGRGAFPKITPWIDDGRRLPFDLGKPAAPNPWRFDGMERLLTLCKAAWRLKDKTPKSLVALKAEMFEAVEKDAGSQTAAVKAYESRILGIVSDVYGCQAAAQPKALALADLTGTTIFCNRPAKGDAADRPAVTVKLLNRLSDAVTGTVRPAGPAAAAVQPFVLHVYRPTTVTVTSRAATTQAAATVTVELIWRDKKIEVSLAPP
jgi:hypothetical protein